MLSITLWVSIPFFFLFLSREEGGGEGGEGKDGKGGGREGWEGGVRLGFSRENGKGGVKGEELIVIISRFFKTLITETCSHLICQKKIKNMPLVEDKLYHNRGE